jgi:hypothetical protein
MPSHRVIGGVLDRPDEYAFREYLQRFRRYGSVYEGDTPSTK